MPPLHMQLKILLPSRVFSVIENVTSISSRKLDRDHLASCLSAWIAWRRWLPAF
jgi:hypothetical protein